MSEEKHGIENLTRGGVLVAKLANQTDESFEDGFQVKDILSYVDEALEIQPVLESVPVIGAEIDDLSTDERFKFIDAIKAELNVGPDGKQELVDEVAAGILDTLGGLQRTRKAIIALRSVAS